MTEIILKSKIIKLTFFVNLFKETVAMNTKFGIFLDIDGCVTSSDGNVCLNSFRANSGIADIVRSAHIGQAPSIRFCSGRDIRYVEAMANFFGMVNIPMIAEDGAVFFNPTTREIKKNPAITAEMQKVFRRVREKDLPLILKRYGCLQEYLGFTICCGFERIPGSAFEIQSVVDFLEGNKIPGIRSTDGKSWRRKPKRESGLLTEFIRKRLLKVERFSDSFVNIVPAGVSKGTAAKSMMKAEGWNPDWCIGIGDTEADFSLFRSVGRIGCPSNATPSCIDFVRNNGGKVSLRSYIEGALDIINWYTNAGDMG